VISQLRDWLLTVPFLLLFGLSLLLFDIAGRVVRPFSLRGFEVVMASLQWTLMKLFGICGTRVIVERHPEVRPSTGYALISNHQSLFDIAMIGGLLFSNYPKYVAKRELGRGIPSISLNLRHGGNAIIDRKNRRQAVEAITEMASTAQRRNVSVVIFPEGTRSRDGRLQRFKASGTEALLDAADRLPVVPTAVDGSWRLLRHNLRPVPYGTTVRVAFGRPIERSPGDADRVLAEAREWIGRTLDGWRVDAAVEGG
jgi:1-acyl-sn-glycerol-3-phosphate acyltransferase